MRSPFKSAFRVTQSFNERPDYYKQFGLKGHEGIDLVPSGTNWDILALEDGKVVTDSDNPKSGAYGNYITIWHPSIKKATQYCHLQTNKVSVGQDVKRGEAIGVMGATGNTQGAHLHLNLFDVDDNGIRLNKTNGYNGGIDPLSFLNTDDSQKIIDELRIARDKNWTLYLEQVELVKQKDTRITELEGKVMTLEKEKSEYQAAALTLNNKIADLNQAMEKDAIEDNDVIVKLRDREKELEDVKGQRDSLLKALTAKDWKEGLSQIDKLRKPNDEIVSEWERLYNFVFTELVARRLPKTKSLIKRIIDRIRGVR